MISALPLYLTLAYLFTQGSLTGTVAMFSGSAVPAFLQEHCGTQGALALPHSGQTHGT
jgi:hypothetical protein